MSTMKSNLKKEKTIEKAKDARNRLSEGKSTINKIRVEYGLGPVEDELFNNSVTTKELSHNNQQ